MNRALLTLALPLLLALPGAAQAVTCQNSIPAVNPDDAYTDNGDGTVTDTRTGLMWAQCAEGLSGENCGTGTASTHTWAAALALAEASELAGHTDWRLLNLKELRSLVEECRINPAINEALFPNTPSSYFWSGSLYAGGSGSAWDVGFDYGNASFSSRSNGIRVRLVRGGQSSDTFDRRADTAAPSLSAVGVSAITAAGATLAATSDEAATGWWIVVARDAAAPTSEQVRAGSAYGDPSVTIVAHGSGEMTADTEKTFEITGLSPGTEYDLYLAAED